MLYKTTLLVLLGLGAGVAVADDLDELIELEEKVKQQFDYKQPLQRILNILDGVSSACLEDKCFGVGRLKIKVEADDCSDCEFKVYLGGLVEEVVTANSPKVVSKCMYLGDPDNCSCTRRLSRIKVEPQSSEAGIKVTSVELLWVTADNSDLTIFKDKVGNEGVVYLLKDIKNNDVFKQATVGSCQN